MIVEIDKALSEALPLLNEPQNVRRIVISGRQRNQNPPFIRIDIRPVLLKAGLNWQEVSHDGKKDFTKNLPLNSLDLRRYLDDGFANLIIENHETELTLRVTKSGQAQLNRKKVNTKATQFVELAHDRSKQRLLLESDPIFTHLGISDLDGKLKPSKTDKFKQVQEFLKNIDYVIEQQYSKVDAHKSIKVVDLGCGHAYLTFAAFRYLEQKNFNVEVLGVDERVDSRNRNSEIANALGISDKVKFAAQKISDLSLDQVDIAIALHACDTATDDAIAWAVKSGAKAILVAPCCQHDIQRQISQAPKPWAIATRYGILQERIGDIITETVRAQTLRFLGYRTDIIEFIAGDHTPKNLMIRAIKQKDSKMNAVQDSSKPDAGMAELELLIAQWQIKPKLLNLLHEELQRLR